MDALLEFFNNFGLTKEQRGLIMRAGWFTVVSGHILWVCGALAGIGLASPFARAETVQQLLTDLQTDRADRTEEEILKMRQDQCKAQKEGNAPAVQLYAQRLLELQGKYFALTHHEARLPNCGEV